MSRQWCEIPIYQERPTYPVDEPIDQYFASLWRQRRAGVPFETAHRQAKLKVRHQHDHERRHVDTAVLEDAGFVAIAEAAYLRKPSRALDAMATLSATIEHDDDLPGFDGISQRDARRSSGRSKAPVLRPERVPGAVENVLHEMAIEDRRYGHAA